MDMKRNSLCVLTALVATQALAAPNPNFRFALGSAQGCNLNAVSQDLQALQELSGYVFDVSREKQRKIEETGNKIANPNGFTINFYQHTDAERAANSSLASQCLSKISDYKTVLTNHGCSSSTQLGGGAAPTIGKLLSQCQRNCQDASAVSTSADARRANDDAALAATTKSPEVEAQSASAASSSPDVAKDQSSNFHISGKTAAIGLGVLAVGGIAAAAGGGGGGGGKSAAAPAPIPESQVSEHVASSETIDTTEVAEKPVIDAPVEDRAQTVERGLASGPSVTGARVAAAATVSEFDPAVTGAGAPAGDTSKQRAQSDAKFVAEFYCEQSPKSERACRARFGCTKSEPLEDCRARWESGKVRVNND